MAQDDLARMARKIDALGRGGSRAAGSGLRVIGEAIMTDVKASRPGKGVPVDTGALRSSGKVSPVREVGPDQVVTLSFGGASARYALRQHEDLTYRHDVGEARYLVRGVERFQADGFEATKKAMAEHVAEAIKRARRAV